MLEAARLQLGEGALPLVWLEGKADEPGTGPARLVERVAGQRLEQRR